MERNEKMEQLDSCTELNYRAAYLRLFGDIAALTERMEAAGARISIGEVHDSLAQALARAEDSACG